MEWLQTCAQLLLTLTPDCAQLTLGHALNVRGRGSPRGDREHDERHGLWPAVLHGNGHRSEAVALRLSVFDDAACPAPRLHSSRGAAEGGVPHGPSSSQLIARDAAELAAELQGQLHDRIRPQPHPGDGQDRAARLGPTQQRCGHAGVNVRAAAQHAGRHHHHATAHAPLRRPHGAAQGRLPARGQGRHGVASAGDRRPPLPCRLQPHAPAAARQVTARVVAGLYGAARLRGLRRRGE